MKPRNLLLVAWVFWFSILAVGASAQTALPDFRDAAGWLEQGYLHYEQGDYATAFDDFDQAVALSPELAEAYVGRGRSTQSLGDYENAIEDYTLALEFDSKYAEAYSHRMLAYAVLGNLDAAMADIETLLKLRPDSAEAHYRRGELHMLLGDPQAAIGDFNRAIAAFPSSRFPPRRRLAAAGQWRKALVSICRRCPLSLACCPL